MNIVKCPKCGSIDLMIYDTEGCIEDGRIVEETECLTCYYNFVVKAILSEIEIEIE